MVVSGGTSNIRTSAEFGRRTLIAGAVATALHTVAGPIPAASALPTRARSRHDIPTDQLRGLPHDGFINHGPSRRPTVAVTIDDWWWTPSLADYLQGVLDLGRRYDAHFTFFPVGGSLRVWLQEQPRESRRLWRRVADEGHVIGNHTETHSPMSRMSASKIHWELADQEKWLGRVLGYHYREHLMRPPGGDGGFPSQGAAYRRTLSEIRRDGYYMTMWSIDSNAPDGRIVTPDEDNRFLAKIFANVRAGSIILVHPTTLSLDGMRRLVEGLRHRSLRMVTVPELFASWS